MKCLNECYGDLLSIEKEWLGTAIAFLHLSFGMGLASRVLFQFAQECWDIA